MAIREAGEIASNPCGRSWPVSAGCVERRLVHAPGSRILRRKASLRIHQGHRDFIRSGRLQKYNDKIETVPVLAEPRPQLCMPLMAAEQFAGEAGIVRKVGSSLGETGRRSRPLAQREPARRSRRADIGWKATATWVSQ